MINLHISKVYRSEQNVTIIDVPAKTTGQPEKGGTVVKTAQRTIAKASPIIFDKPEADDGADVWQLVKSTGVLDLNSAYSYIMLCDYFSDTCVIARHAESHEIAGFVSAFVHPEKRDTLFVWQIATAKSYRGLGIGSRLLREALNREACNNVRYIEATISPSNTASRALFSRLALQLNARSEESEGYSSHLFPGEVHEDERLIRIGPFNVNGA